MQPHTAFPLQNSRCRTLSRILPALVLLLTGFQFAGRPALGEDKLNRDPNLVNRNRPTAGTVEVHLVFTDPDGKQQDYSLTEAPPDFLKKLTPRLQAESKFPLLNPKVRFFEDLWLKNHESVCKEVMTNVQQTYHAGESHEAYNLTCRPFKFGLMYAQVYPKTMFSWPDVNSMGVTVQPDPNAPPPDPRRWQLGISFTVPDADIVPFRLTTPYTCSDAKASGTCDHDPHFTLFWGAYIDLIATSFEPGKLTLGPQTPMHAAYFLHNGALAEKSGYEKDLEHLESKLEQQLAIDVVAFMSDELSVPVVVAQLIYDIFKYGIGGTIDAIGTRTCICRSTRFLPPVPEPPPPSIHWPTGSLRRLTLCLQP